MLAFSVGTRTRISTENLFMRNTNFGISIICTQIKIQNIMLQIAWIDGDSIEISRVFLLNLSLSEIPFIEISCLGYCSLTWSHFTYWVISTSHLKCSEVPNFPITTLAMTLTDVLLACLSSLGQLIACQTSMRYCIGFDWPLTHSLTLHKCGFLLSAIAQAWVFHRKKQLTCHNFPDLQLPKDKYPASRRHN